MSYGVNAPWGLRPMMKQGGSTFDMIETYAIASAFKDNIFKGSLVCLDKQGYIIPFVSATTDLTNANFPIGVFVGCQYTAQSSANPTNPFQMVPMWTGNTVTANGDDAVAYIITDTSVMFNVQANNTDPLIGTGDDKAILGSVASIIDNAKGSLATGQSGMTLDKDTIKSTIDDFSVAHVGALHSNQYPLKIRGVVPVPGNTLGTKTTVGIPFVNLIVSLNNTVYQTGQISA